MNSYNKNQNYIKKRGNCCVPHKKSLSFGQIKHNTICSLNEVDYFLNNLNQFWRYVKLYKFFK